MSARHRQAKNKIAVLADERKRLAALDEAYTLVRAHLKVTPAQSIVAAHAEIGHQIGYLDQRIDELMPKTFTKRKPTQRNLR